MSDKFKGLEFGKYCTIEQKRYGCENEFYQYKVINIGSSNYYRKVPVDFNDCKNHFGEIVPVVKAICCGVSETEVETFRIEDVEPWCCEKYSKDYAIRA